MPDILKNMVLPDQAIREPRVRIVVVVRLGSNSQLMQYATLTHTGFWGIVCAAVMMLSKVQYCVHEAGSTSVLPGSCKHISLDNESDQLFP